jgi:hypothetical protein
VEKQGLDPKRAKDLEDLTLKNGWRASTDSKGAQLLSKTVNSEFLDGKGFIWNDHKYIHNPNDINDGKKFVREMYSKTQSALEKEGIQKIKLYRGIETKINVESVLTSWTTDKRIAKGFDGYKVLEREIEAKDILTYHKEWGDYKGPKEHEYVVIKR